MAERESRYPLNLSASHASNAGLQLVTDSEDADPKASANVRVRVSNVADSKREAFKVGWAQADGRSFVASQRMFTCRQAKTASPLLRLRTTSP